MWAVQDKLYAENYFFSMFIGYGAGYQYNHDYKGPVEQQYLPKQLKNVNFFSSDGWDK